MTKTINVKKSTHERLTELMTKKQTYDDFINILIDFWDEEHKP